MKIFEIGGEFELIKRIARKPKDPSIIKGIGDDAAIIKLKNKYLVITTDMLVENDHFNTKWAAPKQIGIKSLEVNVSDIYAMGGIPKYALISICLTKNTSVEFVDGLYKGIYESAKNHKTEIIGGDTTRGKIIVINITIIGEVKKESICLRSHAKPGDFIFTSGHLGASAAGLNLFRQKKITQHNKKFFKNTIKAHLEPTSKYKKVNTFLQYINAMEDVSDGLASEVTNICNESKVGAVIYTGKVPISHETRKAAKLVRKDPLEFALYGGEDFELVYTVSKKNLNKVKGYLVGEIIKEKSVYLVKEGRKELLKRGGYNHFK